MINDNTVSKYDRIRGGLEGVALFTRASTVKHVETLTGRAETFIVETARHDELGDTVFVEMMDENGVVRLALPPKVSNLIVSQRDALTARRRRSAGKAQAKARKDRGEIPGFMRRKLKK
jgi:hypothetical protein